MPRQRLIKPEFFKHGELYDAEESTGLPLRIAFAGLWCQADRAGRFAWKPRELKTDILPYDPVDFTDVLDALERHGFIRGYTVDGKRFGVIPSFEKHQSFNVKEYPSRLPSPPDDTSTKTVALPPQHHAETVPAPTQHRANITGRGTGNGNGTGTSSSSGRAPGAPGGAVVTALVNRLAGHPRRFEVEALMQALPEGHQPDVWAGLAIGCLDGLGMPQGANATVEQLVVGWRAYLSKNPAKPAEKLFRSCVAHADLAEREPTSKASANGRSAPADKVATILRTELGAA